MSLVKELLNVIDTAKAAELSLSKGGWEGWVQCEWWSYLNLDKDISTEREVKYPTENLYCDLVIKSTCWIEIKVYQIFREQNIESFKNGIRLDNNKLTNYRPTTTNGLLLVVIPKAIEDKILEQIKDLTGLNRETGIYLSIFYIEYS